MKAKKTEHRVSCLSNEGEYTSYVCYDMTEFNLAYWGSSAQNMHNSSGVQDGFCPHRVHMSSWRGSILSGARTLEDDADNYKYGARQ